MQLDIDKALCGATVYRKLSLEDRQALAPVVRVRTYDRKDRLVSEGSPAAHLFTIVSGRVKVVTTSVAGKEVILGIFSSGDEVGAVAVYEERNYPANVYALEPTVCLVVPRRELFRLLKERPSMVQGLLLGLTRRVMELTKRVKELTGSRVESRLARLFVRMASEVGRPERGGIFVPMVLSRKELADMAGTTIETCIRVMSRWKRQDIVRTESDGFVLVDKQELELLAEQ